MTFSSHVTQLLHAMALHDTNIIINSTTHSLGQDEDD